MLEKLGLDDGNHTSNLLDESVPIPYMFMMFGRSLNEPPTVSVVPSRQNSHAQGVSLDGFPPVLLDCILAVARILVS